MKRFAFLALMLLPLGAMAFTYEEMEQMRQLQRESNRQYATQQQAQFDQQMRQQRDIARQQSNDAYWNNRQRVRLDPYIMLQGANPDIVGEGMRAYEQGRRQAMGRW